MPGSTRSDRPRLTPRRSPRAPCGRARAAARWLAAGLVLAGLSGGCLEPARVPQPRRPPATSARLARTLEAAQHRPDDWRAQMRAGSALTRALLEGDVSRFEEAVARLERAHRLHPNTRHIPRRLGRLLNLPLSEGDLRWVDRQRALYRQLADATAVADAPDRERFEDDRLFDATDAAAKYRAHHPVAAVAQLRALERRTERRLRRHDDVDLHAMLGNYAQQIAGLTPVGRGRRVQMAIDHLEPVVRRWPELSAGARGLEYGVPGARVVFTYWLAELYLADGRREHARRTYAQVQRLAEEAAANDEVTPAMRMMAAAAAQRRALEHAPPRDALLPLWPSGYDSCIACHAHEATPDPARAPRPVPRAPDRWVRR